MAIVVAAEQIYSRTASLTEDYAGQKSDMTFILRSDKSSVADQAVDVRNWVDSQAGSIDHYGLPIASADPVELGDGWYRLGLRFGEDRKQKRKDPPKVGDFSFSFAIQTAQQHIRQSRALLKKSDDTGIDSGTGATTNGTSPPDGWEINKSCPIAVDNDRVQGADIFVPQATWQEQYTFADSVVTQGYRLAVMRLVGKTNNALFKGAAEGTALCTAVNGSKQSQNPWNITFDFMYDEGETLTFRMAGGGTVTMTRPGHAIWDFRYDDEFDSVAGHTVRLPEHVLIHGVYESGDFSGFQIGTA